MSKNCVSRNELFITEVSRVIAENISDPDFNVQTLCEKVQMTERTMLRKMQATAGMSPGSYIKKMRLKYASLLLRSDTGSIGEIACAVGFKRISYFSKCFSDFYGIPPRVYKELKQV